MGYLLKKSKLRLLKASQKLWKGLCALQFIPPGADEWKFVLDPEEKPNPLLALNPGKLMLGPSPSPVLHKSVEHD